ncbi:PLD nuclease N-terminal domain-containing protein [Anaerobranca californiensis]|uniref:PLD nuclease N-terminal domain-containing protein n=1 Tax=Anaerobranca californiensis TaxID=182411 RepID=UPI000932D07E|nr:PLD nuclease N-terminal domain-containing protein [Anaerobranca californiensis]
MAIIGCLPIFFLFPLLFFVFWIVTLIDVLRRPESSFRSSGDRVMWILIVFFGNFIGALIYQIFGKDTY